MLSKVIIIRILVSISSEKLFKDIVLRWHIVFLRSRSILSHPPLYRNDCSHFRFTRSHPLCGWLWVNQKREVPNVGGIAMVIIRSFGIAETTSFFRIAVPSFYRLSRQSFANPFPPCHLWQGDRNTVLPAKPYGLFYFPYCPFPCFLPPLMCVFHSPIWDPLFLNGKFISVDGYERVPVFALCSEKNNAGRLRCPQHFLSSKTFLNPSFLIDACRKKKAHKLRWGMKAQKKSRQKEKAIPERGFKKRSLNLAEA